MSHRAHRVVRFIGALLCTAALACSSSSDPASPPEPEPEVDAGPPPTPVSCPDRVPSKVDPYVLRAFVFASDRETTMAGALVEVRSRTDDSTLVTATTDRDGQADLAIPSGGKLLDIYVRATAPASRPDHVPTRVEIQGGQIGLAVQLVVFSTTALQARAASAGVNWDPSKAVVQVGINRCNDGKAATPTIEAATIRVSPGSKTSYAFSGVLFDPKLRVTTVYGGGTDFNVTPGATTITTVKDGQGNTYVTKTEVGVNLFALFQP